MLAFDADVLIYAAAPGHPLGAPVARLFDGPASDVVGIGSVLLLPELLARPLRTRALDEVRTLGALVRRLDLRTVDRATADLATTFGAAYGLRAVDAAHLACAVTAGASRFLTNNRRDFTPAIEEVQITYPEDLPEAH